MLLHDFNRNDKKRFRQINRFLKENFGFTLSAIADEKQLRETMTVNENNIRSLKNNNKTPADKEMSKHLLIQEGLDIMMRNSRQKLDEHSLTNPYLRVLDWLTEFVVNNIEVGDEYVDAMNSAMREYRSSKYRFPDYEVEHDLKKRVQEKLPTIEDAYAPSEEPIEEVRADDVRGNPYGRLNHDTGEHKYKGALDARGLVDKDVNDQVRDSGVTTYMDPNIAAKAKKANAAKARAKAAKANKTGKSTFTLPADNDGRVTNWESKEGKNMSKIKETYVKQLRRLLEAEVDQAEVLTAARGFAKEIQDMVEKLGRLMNEDLSSVSDQMRQSFGPEEAHAFQSDMTSQFEQTISQLRGTKESIDSSVTRLAGDGNDMMDDPAMGGNEFDDAELSGDEFADADLGDEEFADADLGDDEFADAELGDEFGGADLEEPLGRAQKESVKSMKRKIDEMQNLIAKAKKLKQ